MGEIWVKTLRLPVTVVCVLLLISRCSNNKQNLIKKNILVGKKKRLSLKCSFHQNVCFGAMEETSTSWIFSRPCRAAAFGTLAVWILAATAASASQPASLPSTPCTVCVCGVGGAGGWRHQQTEAYITTHHSSPQHHNPQHDS